MFKKLLLGSLLALIVIFGITFFINPDTIDFIPQTTPLPTPKVRGATLTYQDVNYSFAKVVVNDLNSLTLHLNTPEQNSATEVKAECPAIVNGGFYSKENKPLGLFISDSTVLSPRISSSLFDGVLSISRDGEVNISTNVDQTTARLALQTGPLLVQNTRPTKLAIRNDAPERRMVAIKDTSGKLHFVALYFQSSQYTGPLLGDLPAILKANEKVLGITIADAINLDGGTASAFINEQVSLEELSPIGSYFCIN